MLNPSDERDIHMKFSEQIKVLRKDAGMTQEQFANELHVTRQAVSNWENNKNLPDIETVINISSVFHVSLDQLILGGNDMNEMTEKLIHDGSENKRAKYNMVSAAAGTILMLAGMLCIFIKANSVEYIDEAGILHENFFLLPMAALFIFAGLLVIAVSGAVTLFRKRK